jgi:hypothetical protein
MVSHALQGRQSTRRRQEECSCEPRDLIDGLELINDCRLNIGDNRVIQREKEKSDQERKHDKKPLPINFQ